MIFFIQNYLSGNRRIQACCMIFFKGNILPTKNKQNTDKVTDKDVHYINKMIKNIGAEKKLHNKFVA